MQGQLALYRTCTPVIDEKYGHEDDLSPTEVIIDALAEATGVDPTNLPPLFENIDPDAIDSLFDNSAGEAPVDTYLCFRVEDWNVFVHADGRIRVCDATRHTDPEPVFEKSMA